MNMSGLPFATIGVVTESGSVLCSPSFQSHRSQSPAAFACGARFGKLSLQRLESQCSVRVQHLGRIRGDNSTIYSRMHIRLSSEWRICSGRGPLPRPCVEELNFLKKVDFGNSRIKELRPSRIHCSLGVAPLEESNPEAGEEGVTRDQQDKVPVVSLFGENPEDGPLLLSEVPEHVVSQVGGKAGSIAFYGRRTASLVEEREEVIPVPLSRQLLSLVWLLGPFVLVASVVLPPLYLRNIFGVLLEDSLVTDFVILFFTETLFFVGASVFLYIAHISRQSTPAVKSVVEPTSEVFALGYRISARVALAAGVLLPTVTFVIVWPWTGPAAAAALAPYMIGVLVQLGFERIILTHNSSVWPLVPITFQMYRLHQLNRAAQLVAGLLFSLKGVEATAETMAINGSLQTLLFVLQVLGMLCLWSLGSFLTNHLPTKAGQQCIPSLP